MTIIVYRRIKPRLSLVRLVEGGAKRKRYIGWRLNLILWAVEIM